MITGYIPKFSLPSGASDHREGSGLILHTDYGDGYTLVIDGFDGGEATRNLIHKLKINGYKKLWLAESHPHGDHTNGLMMIMDENYFDVEIFYCYDPETIKFGIDGSANGRSVKEDYDNAYKVINKAKKCGAEVVYLNTGHTITIGDITFKVWRKQPTQFTDLDDGNAYAFINNGSLCFYFPDLCFFTSGDGPESAKTAIAYFNGKIYFFQIPHHGNSCSKSNAEAFAEAGAKVAYETNIERNGPGTTGFTAYGARRVKEAGITVLMANEEIYLEANDGKMVITQGSKQWTFDVPYAGAWEKDAKGWKYKDYKDGWYQISGKWYHFNKNGYTDTRWFKNTDGYYRYLNQNDKGAMLVNRWLKVGQHYYWLDGYGRKLVNCAVQVEGKWYYLSSNGARRTGWFKAPDGFYRFCDPYMITNSWVSGIYYVDGYGRRVINKSYQIDGKWYYFDKQGKVQKGWLNLSDGKRYLTPAMLVNCTQEIDGKTYRFDGYGRATEVKKNEATGKLNEITPSRRQFVLDIARLVQQYAPKYGVKVYSPIIAQAILESAWGESSLSSKYHNYFGLKCGTLWKGKSVSMKTGEEYSPGSYTTISANFRAYDSMEQGVEGYFVFLFDGRTRYNNLKGVTDPRTYLQNIKNDGYATSSKYVDNCMALVNTYSLTQFDGTQEAVVNTQKSSGKYPRKDIISLAQSLVGTQEGSSVHRKIIDAYNSYGRQHGNLPRGYAVTYKDAWCATFCSYLAIACGYTSIIPYECGCPQWITQAKGMGIWKEADGYTPKMGDFVLYDWQDSGSGDNTGTPDHIGIVEHVSGITVTVIEGNYQDQVKRRMIQINGRYIRGYVTPKYSD